MLDEETLRLLEAVGSEVEFPAGQVLIEHNTAASGLYVILEGRVAVHAHGEEVELGPGEVVGEIALARGGPRRARVTTITPVRALSVAREHVDAELAKRLAQ
ncbi:MAG: cyclic nucleotide-binding domain-containing protein [Gaiellaceae bacterium]